MSATSCIIAVILFVIIMSLGMTIVDVYKGNANQSNLSNRLLGNFLGTVVCTALTIAVIYIAITI